MPEDLSTKTRKVRKITLNCSKSVQLFQSDDENLLEPNKSSDDMAGLSVMIYLI